MKKLLLWVVAFLMISVSVAQSSTGQVIDTLKEVVVTAQYAPQKLQNSIYPVRSIYIAEVGKQPATHLRELLISELNLDIAQKSVIGASVEMQGLSKENIKILIDGIPVIGRLNGTIDLNQIPLNNVQRLEIIEGPVSVYYGTDALGGVINLITDPKAHNKWDGQISVYHESIKASQITGSIGTRIKGVTLKANAGTYFFDGLSTATEEERNLNWEERKQYFGDLIIGTRIKDIHLNYSGRINQDVIFSLGNPGRHGKIYDKTYYTNRWNHSLQLTGDLQKKWHIKADAYWLNYKRFHDTYNVDPVSFDKELSDMDTRDNNAVVYRHTGMKAQISQVNNVGKMKFAMGVEANNEYTSGARILNEKQDINTVALFGSFNYKWNKWQFQPEARFTYNDAYGSLLSPAFHLKWDLGKTGKLRFSYAKGFRAPSIKELYLDFHIQAGPNTYIIEGNDQLQVEESNSFNLHYSATQLFKNHMKLHVEPSVFYNEVSHLIALSEMKNFLRHYINMEKFKSLGGKIRLRFKSKKMTASTGLAWVGRYNKFSDAYESKEFLFSPEVVTALTYRYDKIHLTASISNKYTGEREGFYIDETTGNLSKTMRKSFNVMDFTLNKSLFNKKLLLSGGVKNIFDVKDVETINELGGAHQRNMQLWGRSFFIKLNYKL